MDLVSSLYRWQYWTRQWCVGRWCALRGQVGADPVAVQAPGRVLIIVTGRLGDTVMSTPLIVEARRLWPGATITMLGQRHNCELLSACPLIDASIETPAIPFSLRNRRQLARLKCSLRAQRFDLAIIALGDQFAKLLWDLKTAVRVGVRGHPLSSCLTHTYEVGCPHACGPSTRLGALRSLGFAVREPQARLWVSNGAREAAREKLRELGLPEQASYAVLHAFGARACKWWPLERIGELAERLRAQHGLRTVVIGGLETRGRIPKSACKRVIDATGALGIQHLLGAMQDARLVISTDSGPFHMAGALGCPLVGLFRARRPEHARHYPQAQIVFGQGPCHEARCKGDHCQAATCPQLGALSVTEVLNAVRLAQQGNPASRKRVSQRTN